MEPWEEALWEAVSSRIDTEQIIYTGELITYIQQTLVPALAHARRLAVIRCLDSGMTNGILADTIGTRPGTVARLAEEGRRAVRESLDT